MIWRPIVFSVCQIYNRSRLESRGISLPVEQKNRNMRSRRGMLASRLCRPDDCRLYHSTSAAVLPCCSAAARVSMCPRCSGLSDRTRASTRGGEGRRQRGARLGRSFRTFAKRGTMPAPRSQCEYRITGTTSFTVSSETLSLRFSLKTPLLSPKS